MSKFQSYYLQQNNVDQISYLKKTFWYLSQLKCGQNYIQKTKLQPFMVDIVGEIMYVNIVQWKLIDFA